MTFPPKKSASPEAALSLSREPTELHPPLGETGQNRSGVRAAAARQQPSYLPFGLRAPRAGGGVHFKAVHFSARNYMDPVDSWWIQTHERAPGTGPGGAAHIQVEEPDPRLRCVSLRSRVKQSGRSARRLRWLWSPVPGDSFGFASACARRRTSVKSGGKHTDSFWSPFKINLQSASFSRDFS